MTLTSIDLNHIRDLISQNLQEHLQFLLPNHPIKEAYHYAIFPTGKLFRPLLVYSLHKDLTDPSTPNPFLTAKDNLSYLASFLEIHHAYTLVHDDLPCMDNDSMRRNRPATHIRYGEGMALLIGDGLINASYQVLTRIHSHPATGSLLRFLSWCVGPKGLIQGQALDLSLHMKQSFNQLLETHQYKTARLIQAALVGTFMLIPQGKLREKTPTQSSYRLGLDLFKLGLHVGLTFQLLDDLHELTSTNIGTHEKHVNPFFNFPQDSLDQLLKSGNAFRFYLKKYSLENLSYFLQTYLENGREVLIKNWNNIEEHIHHRGPCLNLDPMKSFLDGL